MELKRRRIDEVDDVATLGSTSYRRELWRMLYPLRQKKSSILLLQELKVNRCWLFSISLPHGVLLADSSENLAGKLKELKCYICESKKEEEVIGADATSIVHTMKRLYNMMDLKPDEESKEEVNALPEEEENDNLMIDELIPLLKQAKKYAFLPVVLLRGKIRDITIQGCI
ncbi:hypothetical protein V6N13_020536 [Hibiscus sabdariffa]